MKQTPGSEQSEVLLSGIGFLERNTDGEKFPPGKPSREENSDRLPESRRPSCEFLRFSCLSDEEFESKKSNTPAGLWRKQQVLNFS